jgi:urea transporter/murein DD-endopeptidase MepM/ murein hydrolase activator NlpD
MVLIEGRHTILKGLIRSYSQIFFSTNYFFAILLLLISFIDLSVGLAGIVSALVAIITSYIINLEREVIAKGLYGFNALLVGLGLGFYFDINITLLLLAAIAGFFTLLVNITLQGVLGKYYLPYLSLPFVLSMWLVLSATWQLTSIEVNQSSVYLLNEIFRVGGLNFISIHDWWISHVNSNFINGYFISLGSIFFHFNVLAGVLVALALLLFSRIAFSLSLLGYSVAYFAYLIFGLDITTLGYSEIGFNFILTAIAIGGYYYIPSSTSYLWAVAITPVVAMVTTGLVLVLKTLGLPILSLPFNMIVLMFIYSLRFRTSISGIREVVVQEGKPELNLYSYQSFTKRFPNFGWVKIKLPFFGVWSVNQAHNGEFTHKGEWAHAWDFVVLDSSGKQFKNNGNVASDYYCYGKSVIAPADGEVVEVEDGIDENPIGEINIAKNWGNTVIIRHAVGLYSKVSHLKKGSIAVRAGDKVRFGAKIGEVGNSGRSAYPHLHFQIQANEYIGSKTIKYPISSFIVNGSEVKTFDYPKLDDRVCNIETDSLLVSVFNFKPGQVLSWSVKKGESIETESWEVGVTYLNKLYIRCNASGAKAFFELDDVYFYFTHFDGDKKSLLYKFYLAAYRVPLTFLPGLVVNDSIPVNKTFSGLTLYLHDFIAPFKHLIHTDFRLNAFRIGSDFDTEGYRFETVVAGRFLKGELWTLNYELEVQSNRRIIIRNKQEKTMAICEL